MIVAPSLLGDWPLLTEIVVACGFAVGWTTILVSALIGAGLSGVASGIKQGIEGDFDAGQFFKDVGIGFGTGGLTAGLGSALGAVTGTAASAGQSAAANVAAAPVGQTAVEGATQVVPEVASQAASATPGTFGATGTAVQEGAVAPLGSPGGLASSQAPAEVTREAIKSAQAPQLQSLLSQGNAMAAAPRAPMLGPSYPQFQQATSIARGEIPQAVNWIETASRALPKVNVAQDAVRQAVVGGVTGAARGFAEGNGDWRGPVYGALGGALSSGIVPSATTALSPTFGRVGAGVATRALSGAIGGAVRGAGASDDSLRGALAGAATGAVGSGASSALTTGWNSITKDLMPLKEVDSWRGVPYARDTDPLADFNKIMANPYTSDGGGPRTSFALPQRGDPEWAQAMGVSAMRAVGNRAIGMGVGAASDAVGQAISPRRPLVPPGPTSGPALYSTIRGIVPSWQRTMRRF